MAIGDPGKESFRRVITEIRNQHIVAALQPVMLFREELVMSDDFSARFGLDNTSRDHFLKHLLNCDRMRRRVTYNPEGVPLGDSIAKAIDPTGTIETGVKPSGGDEIQGQTVGMFLLPWDFSGADPNIPMLSSLNMASGVGIILLNAIDAAITQWTNVESRLRSKFITVTDSLRMYGNYQQIYTYLMDFGGDNNQVDIANPRATDIALGPDNAPNRRSETIGTITGSTK
jgi:hypothetical protein